MPPAMPSNPPYASTATASNPSSNPTANPTSSPASNNTAPSPFSPIPPPASSSSPRLGVLGIGLVVEEVGKGARLVFRYPAAPPPFFLEKVGGKSGSGAQNAANSGGGSGVGIGGGAGATGGGTSQQRGAVPSSPKPPSNSAGGATDTGSPTFSSSSNPSTSSSAQAAGSIDLFFDLPARVISKLFRPKRPLCGQPLTLNVSGTTFCCRAELFDSTGSHSHHPSSVGGGDGSTSSSGQQQEHPLVLFSVIVALAPLASCATSSLDLGLQDQFQFYGNVGITQTHHSGGNPLQLGAGHPPLHPNQHQHQHQQHNQHSHQHHHHRMDPAFTTIHRIHQNLARLCRVLTREEVRCRYVSLQCSMLLNIRKEYEDRVGPDGGNSGFHSKNNSSVGNTTNSTGAGPNSGGTTGNVGVSGTVGNSTSGNVSNNTTGVGTGSASDSNTNKKVDTATAATNIRRVSNPSISAAGLPPPPPPAVAASPVIAPKEKRPSSTNPKSDSKSNPGGGGGSSGKGGGGSDNSTISGKMSPLQRREYVQNLIEIMLAASPPDYYSTMDDHDTTQGDSIHAKDGRRRDGSIATMHHHGNLARELAQLFHSLSKNDDPNCTMTYPSVLSRVSARDGVVYINRHIAVPLEPVDIPSVYGDLSLHGLNLNQGQDCVRPYHTLLFPHSSPSEILRSLLDDTGNSTNAPSGTSVKNNSLGGNPTTPSATPSASSTSISEFSNLSSLSHTLRRILPHIHPRKSLQEVAWDSAISLPHIMDAATWLIRSGICVRLMPVVRKNRYTCVEGVVAKMAKLSMPFWQAFGNKSQNCRFCWSDIGNKRGGESGEMDGNAASSGGGGGAKHTSVSGKHITTGAPHIFVVVSALTTIRKSTSDNPNESGGNPSLQGGAFCTTAASPTLGNAIDAICDVEDSSVGEQRRHQNSDGQLQRLRLEEEDSPFFIVTQGGMGGKRRVAHRRSSTGDSSGMVSYRRAESVGVSVDGNVQVSMAEDLVYSMAVWLLSQKVIVEMKEYLIALRVTNRGSTHGDVTREFEKPSASFGTSSSTTEEVLYQELLDSGCLKGTVSIPAICYRFGLDRLRMDRLKAWGEREELIKVISRAAWPTDDWGCP